MELHLRLVREDDIEALVELSWLAWEPIFPSFEQILGPAIYQSIWPDWRAGQKEVVEGVCRDEETAVWVAAADGKVIGFVAYQLHGDSSHAPARRSYEKAGYTGLPLVRYFQDL